jgi:cell division transport system permease protein
MRALRYALDEALASLWRGRRSGALSTATIALALFVLGAFLILVANLQQLGAEWSSAAEISVYLRDDVTAAERQAIAGALGPGAGVAGLEFVSKGQALARFKQMFSDLGAAADTLGDNPLPASYEVRLRADAAAQGGLDALGERLRQMPGVADVRYDRQWLGRLAAAIALVRAVGLALATVLTLAAALTVATVVRLALYARRDEIEIMQLVGAPTLYVRGPFGVEGILQGGIGGLLALGALAAGFFALRGAWLVPLAAAMNLPAIRFLPVELAALLVVGGMAVGGVGGIVAAWGR